MYPKPLMANRDECPSPSEAEPGMEQESSRVIIHGHGHKEPRGTWRFRRCGGQILTQRAGIANSSTCLAVGEGDEKGASGVEESGAQERHAARGLPPFVTE